MENRLILLFSGKRKSGKDFICEKLKTILGEDNCEIIHISGPLKKTYAEHHKLNFSDLMSDGPYKENYRLKMIKWSDEIRAKDPGFFCRAACQTASPKKIWIVSDIRRKTDIEWFRNNYNNVKTIRVQADLNIRKERGWIYTEGIDNVTSECDLDNFDCWDIEIYNNNEQDAVMAIDRVLSLLQL